MFLSPVFSPLIQAADLRLGTFEIDVTPPIGDGPCVGFMPRVDSIEHPLKMKGIVLKNEDDTFVIAAIDFCGICNTSDEVLRDALAHAAGTTRSRVALQSLHQHTAPALDADAVAILHGEDSPQLAQHRRFTDDIAQRSADAIGKAIHLMRPVTKIVGSRAKVDKVASNRRVPMPDGSIGVRASVTRDQVIREAPEGLIDPWLRTVTFFDGERKLVQLHYYATHPQSFYGDSRVTCDTVGLARDLLERESGVPQIYFTGCGGNVTLGKYNDGTVNARDELTRRILAAMTRSADEANPNSKIGVSDKGRTRVDAVVDPNTLGEKAIQWSVAPIKFTARSDGAFDPDLLSKQLAPEHPFPVRLTAAEYSAFGQRLKNGYVAEASRLRIGVLDIVHLPGEPFVEFQLFAQAQAKRDTFVCVAGYGECGVWYYGPDQIYRDRGGYEQTWSVTQPCQEKVEGAILQLLKR